VCGTTREIICRGVCCARFLRFFFHMCSSRAPVARGPWPVRQLLRLGVSTVDRLWGT
jgi:hypothetical protein